MLLSSTSEKRRESKFLPKLRCNKCVLNSIQICKYVRSIICTYAWVYNTAFKEDKTWLVSCFRAGFACTNFLPRGTNKAEMILNIFSFFCCLHWSFNNLVFTNFNSLEEFIVIFVFLYTYYRRKNHHVDAICVKQEWTMLWCTLWTVLLTMLLNVVEPSIFLQIVDNLEL